MIIGGWCGSFKKDILMGVHRPEDVYKIALYDGAANLNALTSDYSKTNEVKGKGYSAGGVTLEGYSCEQEGTSAFLSWSKDPVWPVATIEAHGALIYNSSRNNKAVIVLDFNEAVVSTNGKFLLPMPACACATGLLRLT